MCVFCALISVHQQIGKGHLADMNIIKAAPLGSPTLNTEMMLAMLLSGSFPHHQPDELVELKVRLYGCVAIYGRVFDVSLFLPSPHNNAETMCHPMLGCKIKG